MKEMSVKLKLYTGFVILLGIISIIWGIKSFHPPIMTSIVFFACLGIVSESLGIRVQGAAAISVSYAIGLGAVLVFKSPVVAIIGFLSMLLFIEKIDGRIVHIFNSSIYKRVFNGSAYAVSLLISSIVYDIFSNYYKSLRLLDFSIPGIIMSVLCYIFINTLIYLILMAFLESKSVYNLLKDNIWAIINLVAISPLGVVTAIVYKNYGWFAVLLFFGPLLVARYSFKLYMDMRHVYFETIKALANAVEAKDKYTIGHSYRVADYAVGIAEHMGFRQDTIDRIKTAAILHDIGKIGISDSILNKPGKLEDNEYFVIQKHPEIGAKILSEVDFLGDVSKIIKYHHERFDGKGYPEGLQGAEIPIEASILSVADAFDAMTSDRPYRKAMDQSTAMNILLKEAGVQFNPIVVKAFRDYLHRNREEIAHVG